MVLMSSSVSATITYDTITSAGYYHVCVMLSQLCDTIIPVWYYHICVRVSHLCDTLTFSHFIQCWLLVLDIYVLFSGTLGAFPHNNDSSSEAQCHPNGIHPPPFHHDLLLHHPSPQDLLHLLQLQDLRASQPGKAVWWAWWTVLLGRNYVLTIAAADQYFMLVKKEELETGEVNRLCATQEKCDSATSSPLSTCCSGDRCNTSSTYSSLPDMAWVVVMAVVRQTLLVT